MAMSAAASTCHCSRFSRERRRGEGTGEEQPAASASGHPQPDHAGAKARGDAGQGQDGQDAAGSHPQAGEDGQAKRRPQARRDPQVTCHLRARRRPGPPFPAHSRSSAAPGPETARTLARSGTEGGRWEYSCPTPAGWRPATAARKTGPRQGGRWGVESCPPPGARPCDQAIGAPSPSGKGQHGQQQRQYPDKGRFLPVGAVGPVLAAGGVAKEIGSQQGDEPPRPEGQLVGKLKVGERAGPLRMGRQLGGWQKLDGGQGQAPQHGQGHRPGTADDPITSLLNARHRAKAATMSRL